MLPLETRTAVQYPDRHRRAVGRDGLHPCGAYAALTEDQDIWVLLNFAFIPVRYNSSSRARRALPGRDRRRYLDLRHLFVAACRWTHLGVNAIWMLAFGSAVARRFGAMRFLAFFVVTAAAGAAMHLLTNAGSQAPMIGASAAISGAMAAAMRFAFQRGGPLGALGSRERRSVYACRRSR